MLPGLGVIGTVNQTAVVYQFLPAFPELRFQILFFFAANRRMFFQLHQKFPDFSSQPVAHVADHARTSSTQCKGG
jgi:hypothetical protein